MLPIEFLLQRQSCGQLTEPAPSDEQLTTLMACAARAPDHGLLQPYRFVVVDGDRLQALGQCYRDVLQRDGETDLAKLERAQSLPLRAPMIIVAIAKQADHPKAPKQEQLITAGIATANIIAAAQALGLGAYWRTGELAYHRAVQQALGCCDDESIIGFVYIGTPKSAARDVRVQDPSALWQRW